MSWIFSTSNQNNPREVQLASPCSPHFHSKRFLQGSWEFALPLCFHCMGFDKDTAFEAAQWPSAFSTIVSMSLNSSKLLNLSVTCWGYSGPTDSLFVCDTAFTFCPSHVSVLAPDAFFWRWVPGAVKAVFLLFLLQSCKRLAILHLPSPQLLLARPDSQLTTSHAFPKTSSFAKVNHMH